MGFQSRAQPQPKIRPLDGLTVVSLEHAVAAPLATRQLADLGARVIKVERPGTGDFARAYDNRVAGLSSHFVWCNRSKESLTLNLKNAEALDILRTLVGRADVVVQNLAPGAAARLGLAEADVRPRHPRLILCDISGYGSDGPYRDRKAYDLLIQSEAGFLSITGTPDVPSKAGISIADIAAAMYAYSGVLSALLLRERTGNGSHVEISMLEALGEWMGFPLYYAYEGAPPPPRTGASHATIAPYGPFPAGDGRSVMLGLQNEREWTVFCDRVLGRPELAADDRFATNSLRVHNQEALREIITAIFASATAQAIAQRLNEAGIANARVRELQDVWDHPQLRARSRWVDVDSPAGPIAALLPPADSGSFDYRMDGVPVLGAHTDGILAELGLSAAEIARLHREGAV
jgi:crotonobetainyl-CoA:carnitine CoA-transferase CaiB-like acyl-CoA transferase